MSMIVRTAYGFGAQSAIAIKCCLLLLALAPLAARAAEPVAQLEIFRDVPDIQDSYIVAIYPDHEELSVSSNLFFLPRQEFGRYVRPRTDLLAKVEELIASGANFQKPESRTLVLTGWHATLKGEELDALDPRFQKTFALMSHTIEHGGWRREDVTTVKLKRGVFLHVARLQYSNRHVELTRPHITRTPVLDGLEACPDVINDHLVCRVRKGFILLAKPGHRYK
ncbi:hypothetical protein SAMN05216330_1353 [Bradyrhizobium sp. Ghvi]|uniref:hypothetical protein n=1 Tax=Bradyrhizobium sp. Ghvi TaxID=1855319 RepID=UPI0008E22348|nr:hypothetical protein [Bradyrhizobium sp. Ghvi]SFQ36928.1 hypothetical protein SAMN05216330_1353 [Bradyrhizobium sp. Ghvi]